jgi:hypothetical protein
VAAVSVRLVQLEAADAPRLAALVADPSVGEAAGLPPNWSATVALDRAYVWGWGEPELRGAFVLHVRADGTIGPHVLVSKEARGNEAVTLGRVMLEYLRRCGRRIVGRTPVDRRDALVFAHAIGMKRIGMDGDTVVTEAI